MNKFKPVAQAAQDGKFPFQVAVPIDGRAEIGNRKLGDEITIMAKTKILSLSSGSVELGIKEVAFMLEEK